MRSKKERGVVGKPCTESGKLKFRSATDALIYNMHNPRPMRAYKCPDCGFYHAATRRVQGRIAWDQP